MGVAEELEDWEEEYGSQVAILEQEVSTLKLALTQQSRKSDDGRFKVLLRCSSQVVTLNISVAQSNKIEFLKVNTEINP